MIMLDPFVENLIKNQRDICYDEIQKRVYASLSHELRTPMNTSLNLLSML